MMHTDMACAYCHDPLPTVSSAQLYWDDQDPNNSGWWLHYYVDGTEDGESIDGERDASLVDLTTEVANALSGYARAKVTVFRGEQPCGRIYVDGGRVIDWRCW